jgi:hypothetical protein
MSNEQVAPETTGRSMGISATLSLLPILTRPSCGCR